MCVHCICSGCLCILYWVNVCVCIVLGQGVFILNCARCVFVCSVFVRVCVCVLYVSGCVCHMAWVCLQCVSEKRSVSAIPGAPLRLFSIFKVLDVVWSAEPLLIACGSTGSISRFRLASRSADYHVMSASHALTLLVSISRYWLASNTTG